MIIFGHSGKEKARMNVPIEAGKTALVLVDMQNLALAYAGSNPKVAENTRTMVDFAHENGIPVIYTKLNMREDLRDRPESITDFNLSMNQIYPSPCYFEGSKDQEIIPQLEVQSSDFVVVKRRMSAFTHTDLELYLRTMGIRTILMGGIATELGVAATAMAGRDLDFNIVILTDCCATSDPAIQDFMVQHVFFMIARSMTSEEARKIIVK
jgi:nicotinamidase-related amidase